MNEKIKKPNISEGSARKGTRSINLLKEFNIKLSALRFGFDTTEEILGKFLDSMMAKKFSKIKNTLEGYLCTNN